MDLQLIRNAWEPRLLIDERIFSREEIEVKENALFRFLSVRRRDPIELIEFIYTNLACQDGGVAVSLLKEYYWLKRADAINGINDYRRRDAFNRANMALFFMIHYNPLNVFELPQRDIANN